MPARPNPTARQVRLGAELRRLRDASGIESRDAAAFLGTNQTQISHIEAGRFGISEERLRRLTGFYGCHDAQLVDALVEMANPSRRSWWVKFRGLMPPRALDIAELEHHASYIRVFEAVSVPGLLQTEEYVRSTSLYLDPRLPESERETRVEFRMRRQQILASGTPYDAIVHEAALRMRVGGSKVTRSQLEHLLSASEQETVTIRVVPFTADGFAGAGLAMQYVGGVVPQLDTVQTDTPQGAVFTDAPARLQRCRTRLERIDNAALTQDASLDLIRRIAKEL
ncbi:helix-turn-helix domain-containing protein [Streptomyces ipomoeae]|uniref:Toxin-antitoxin system, antitoxin component, Xre family n=1 Tax=Streptomyces ipomoeae 91-03 TaxID=698759 RepID=L1KRG1_9ACTN|nr:helix-turn-helix transcriptional regulator [Streptomyces ipomoeae]EKX62958.1 toxin-antitoxin system, antitoxin component, Xre family [Streptomyces ipomoeae 91-03]MDX2700570.1 helix-turn-helix transcriptional regulator [Streptomyces ipomoeae]MDX2846218.1 helix-turn-helix transcriptional regulator [Streptomyces ipomoeae]